MSEPAGLKCPGCGEPPAFVLGDGRQAFCDNEGCPWFMWDPTMTLAELNAAPLVVQLPGDGDD